MSRSVKRTLLFALGICVSAVSLWFSILKDTSLSELWLSMGDPNYWWVLPNLLFVILAMHQRSLRWRTMLSPIKTVQYNKLLAATCIGFMANNILPFRLGEYVRADSLARQDSDIAKSTSLATIFVERMVFDLIALLLILGGVIYVSPFEPDPKLEIIAYVAVIAAMVGVCFIAVISLRPEKAGNMLTRYLFFLPLSTKEKIKDVVIRFAAGLQFMRDPVTFINVAVQTLLIWLFMGFSNYFVFLAFGFDLPLEASYVLLVVVSVSILIPSSPGFFGVYHAGAVLTLSLYNIPDVDARAFSIVLHLAQYIPITLLGFYYLKKAHLSLKSLEEEAVGNIG